MDESQRQFSRARRNIMVSAAALVATNGVNAISPPVVEASIVALDTDSTSLDLAAGYHHLTINEAKRIAASFKSFDMLDLTQFSTASPNALWVLARLDYSFVELGLTVLDLESAEVLGLWNSLCLSFPRLTYLTADIAGALVSSCSDLDFPGLTGLDIETAKALVCYPYGNASLLSLGGLFDLTPSVAEVLAFHDNVLSIRVSQLTPEAARALALHRGYSLEVLSASSFPTDSFHAFADTSMKQAKFIDPIQGEDSIWWYLKFEATKAWWAARMEKDRVMSS